MTRFRLMTANLFTRYLKVDHFEEVLTRVDPDILVAVEMIPEAAEVIAARFPDHILRPDPGFLGWGIASRFPARFHQDREVWRGGRGEVEVEGTTLHIAAVHITDPVFGNWRVNAGHRSDQVDALFRWADEVPYDEPLVIAGDFNASPVWKVYRRLASRFDDLVAEGAKVRGRRPERTWGPGINLLRIDHVLGRGLRGVGTSTEKIRGSDHSAVVVDLEF